MKRPAETQHCVRSRNDEHKAEFMNHSRPRIQARPLALVLLIMVCAHREAPAIELTCNEFQPHVRVVCPQLAPPDSIISYTCFLRWTDHDWCFVDDERGAALDTTRWTNLHHVTMDAVFTPVLAGTVEDDWEIVPGDTVVVTPLRQFFDDSGVMADTVFIGELCEFYFEAELLSGAAVRTDTSHVYFDNLAPGAPGKPASIIEE